MSSLPPLSPTPKSSSEGAFAVAARKRASSSEPGTPMAVSTPKPENPSSVDLSAQEAKIREVELAIGKTESEISGPNKPTDLDEIKKLRMKKDALTKQLVELKKVNESMKRIGGKSRRRKTKGKKTKKARRRN